MQLFMQLIAILYSLRTVLSPLHQTSRKHILSTLSVRKIWEPIVCTICTSWPEDGRNAAETYSQEPLSCST